MGGAHYRVDSRTVRAATMGFATNSIDDNFGQNKKRVIHESMSPAGIQFRESRDSENHPRSVPIVLGLDVTGSMREIPQWLVINGLPHIMDGIIQRGLPDPQILFLGIGDHECDHHPLQVGQFESGDLELDTWLTRLYLEGGGGGNAGESYILAWYFAAMHTVTDAWEKRQEKGFIFTIGDEPPLDRLPANVISGLMGSVNNGEGYTLQTLLELARERYHVFHIHIDHERYRQSAGKIWTELLGQNCIILDSKEKVAKAITDIVLDNTKMVASPTVTPAQDIDGGTKTEEEIRPML